MATPEQIELHWFDENKLSLRLALLLYPDYEFTIVPGDGTAVYRDVPPVPQSPIVDCASVDLAAELLEQLKLSLWWEDDVWNARSRDYWSLGGAKNERWPEAVVECTCIVLEAGVIDPEDLK